jgi:hypothetical protein
MITAVARRVSPQLVEIQQQLGPLSELIGRWVGEGFNLVLLPVKDGTPPFRLLLNRTIESLEFTAIGASIPDRGFIQEDLCFSGLTYLQQITDANTHDALHLEAGQWFNVPETNPASGNASVVRQATILHGDALLAQGPVIQALMNLPPTIDPVSPSPTVTAAGQPITNIGYLAQLSPSALPPGVPAGFMGDPNQVLRDAIQGKSFAKIQVLNISTHPDGGIVNIPFI